MKQEAAPSRSSAASPPRGRHGGGRPRGRPPGALLSRRRRGGRSVGAVAASRAGTSSRRGRGGPLLRPSSRKSLGVSDLVVRRLGAAPSAILFRLPRHERSAMAPSMSLGARVVSIVARGRRWTGRRVVEREADGALALASVVRPSTGAEGDAKRTLDGQALAGRSRAVERGLRGSQRRAGGSSPRRRPLTVHARQLRPGAGAPRRSRRPPRRRRPRTGRRERRGR